MTDTTQDIDLQAVAQAWREKVDAAHRQRNEEHNKAERERARENGQHVFNTVLGQDLAHAGVKLPPLTWMAEEPDEDTARWSATATVAGFMFRARKSYQGVDYGYSRDLSLLRLCSKDAGHGFEQTPVGSLYDLAEILTDPTSVTWTCGVCSWEAYEERENQQAAEPVKMPTLAQQLEDLIGRIVEDRLDARETY
jgi:hypothetical protein